MWKLLVPLALLAVPVPVLAGERADRLEIPWGSTLPGAGKDADPLPAKPLLVYVTNEHETRDQRRFDEVLLKNESFLLAAKFFACVKVPEGTARKHALFRGVRFRAPAVVVFDSTRKKHAVAGGRASAMKVYALLVKMGRLDWETDIAKTVRAARNLLGTFDQVDAARDSLSVKEGRLEDARGKKDGAKIRRLEKEIARDRAAMEALYAKAEKRWKEIWSLVRKDRAAEGAKEKKAPEKAKGK